ncbi:MAG: DHHA1 domain-containing protein, partial [Nanoarchaeota archaeon]
MLPQSQINEIKEHLQRAQNPLFFFDNDNDGLCSFLLLRRSIGRGRGVAIKSFPELHASYYSKIKELNPDYVFILDKPNVSTEFIQKVKEDNIPIVWIDHHQTDGCSDPDVFYYNHYLINKTNEPISAVAYAVAAQKEDIWIALIGCISDCFLPEFYNKFEKKFPELCKRNQKSAFDILYNAEIGTIARILDFSLKDTTTNVVAMIKCMIKIKNPIEILQETAQTKQMHKRYNEINTKYQQLLNKARERIGDAVVYFQYGGNLSVSSNIANQLSYEFPNKIIIVAYIKGDVANISLRGKHDVRSLTLNAIKDIDGATGGGHLQATGAKVSISDLPKFKERIEE